MRHLIIPALFRNSNALWRRPITTTPHHWRFFSRFMIVCSCNVLSDGDVRHAVNAANDAQRNAKQIYECLGCSAECGRCARTIKTIIDEAYRECVLACQAGCPHSQIMDDAGDEPKVAPAAP